MTKTIMIVDDSATMIMSLRNNLEIAGFKVESAQDGSQALARLKAGVKPDLIITDINMPNMGAGVYSCRPCPARVPLHTHFGLDHRKPTNQTR